MDDEEELVFKRFPADKQDQVRQLVGYAMLMGLSGKDLVSIGGKLDRLKLAREKNANLEIIKGFDCLLIGQDKSRSRKEDVLDERFRLKTTTGSYSFENHYNGFKITSHKTKVSVTHRVDGYDYALGTISWRRRARYGMLLDISSGKITLNF
jgi:hypothetical protein